MSPVEYHSARKEHFSKVLSALKSKDRLFSMARMSAILLAAFLFYKYFQQDFSPLLYLGLILVAAFFFMLNRHLRLRDSIARTKILVAINEDELKYLQGDLSPFDKGNDLLEHDHLYAHDLDLFGELSLFRHLNRTSTSGGRSRLSQKLLSKSKADILRDQEAVKEMSSDNDWRQAWQAAGQSAEEDAHIGRSIEKWLAIKPSNSPLLSMFILVPLAALCIGLIIYLSFNDSQKIVNLSAGAFSLNLLVVAFHIKSLKEEASAIGPLVDSMKTKAELLDLIEKRTFRSELLQENAKRLDSSGRPASENMRDLIAILGHFEQMNNLIVLPLFNGLFLFHLHALRSVIKWRKEHGHVLFDWLQTIDTTDMWVSLGNYAHTHPSYSYPTLSESTSLIAKGIGHPLMNAVKRVDNDLAVKDYNYVILTGSNMSGKSTFLKSIGLNLVLTRCGLPVCAQDMQTYPFKVVSSMKAFDSLLKEESFFHAEVLRLKKVMEQIQDSQPCFVLLDEILRGTNSDDKRKGTRLFLEKISAHNSIGVIATHDVDIAELADQAGNVFQAKFFESKVQHGALTFDYTLRDGVCVTANATDLMRANGII